MYQKNTENGYIVSIVSGVTNGNITEAEYNATLEVIRNKPTPPEGYDYKLKENLEWELYELPPAPPPEDEEATEEDYKSALNALGVNTDEEE